MGVWKSVYMSFLCWISPKRKSCLALFKFRAVEQLPGPPFPPPSQPPIIALQCSAAEFRPRWAGSLSFSPGIQLVIWREFPNCITLLFAILQSLQIVPSLKKTVPFYSIPIITHCYSGEEVIYLMKLNHSFTIMGWGKSGRMLGLCNRTFLSVKHLLNLNMSKETKLGGGDLHQEIV